MIFAYPDQLVPFSQFSMTLPSMAIWGASVEDPVAIDRYIGEIWGFKANDLRTKIEIMEYKAWLAHIVYLSLIESREIKH